MSLSVSEAPVGATPLSPHPADLSVEAGLSDRPPTAAPVERRDTAQRSLVPVVVGGATTLVALGVGIGFRLSAASRHDDVLRLQEKNGASGCANGTASSSDCTAQREAVESEDSRRRISTTAFVVAGIAAVGTAVYWFWPRPAAHSGAAQNGSLRLSGAVTPGGSGLWLSGNF